MGQTAVTPRERREPPRRRPVLTLVVLPSRKAEFFGNLGAALRVSGSRLPFEEKLGHVAPGWIGASTLLHLLVLAVWLMLPKIIPKTAVVVELDEEHKYDVVYYRARALPQMEDAGGSMAGTSGTGGGREAFHPTQVIRISRAPTLMHSVVDEPKLSLPRIAGSTANILSLSAMPAPAVPVLNAPPAPIPITRTESRITRIAAPVAKADLRVASGQMPALVPPPVSAVARAAPESRLVLPPAPRPVMPARAEIATTTSPAPELTLNSVTPLPASSASETSAAGSGTGMKAEAVVVSTNPGEAIGAPANGAPGSLAMSPKGHEQPGLGGEGEGGGIARGSGPGSSAVGSGSGASSSGPGPGAGPSATSGTSLAKGPGGSGSGGTPAIPGVVVRGGVVSLGSFGPKPGPNSKPAADPRKSAAITVIATGRSGGGLDAYHTFKSQQVYTIYVDTKAGPVVLQFAGRESATAYNGDLTPPDPVSTDVPPLPAGTGVLLSCVLDAAGRLQNIRVLRGAVESTRAFAQAVANWRFHPVLSDGQPIAVDALIGIGMGVR